MGVYSFLLQATPQLHVVSLRELNGHDELLTSHAGTIAILNLLGNVIVAHSSSGELPVGPEKISIADRDYLLAGIFKYTYGSHIESNINCRSCSKQFDINFSLDDLVAHTKAQSSKMRIDDNGYFTNEDGFRFRLPAGEDELAVSGLSAAEAETLMIQRCVQQSPQQLHTTDFLKMMEQAAPVLITDTEVQCPECGQSQQARFDMQIYLLTKMKNEKKRVAAAFSAKP
ncbi:MAG: hypothetical protein EOO02_18315, partial [Chitinophagaceae bacterium]